MALSVSTGPHGQVETEFWIHHVSKERVARFTVDLSKLESSYCLCWGRTLAYMSGSLVQNCASGGCVYIRGVFRACERLVRACLRCVCAVCACECAVFVCVYAVLAGGVCVQVCGVLEQGYLPYTIIYLSIISICYQFLNDLLLVYSRCVRKFRRYHLNSMNMRIEISCDTHIVTRFFLFEKHSAEVSEKLPPGNWLVVSVHRGDVAF